MTAIRRCLILQAALLLCACANPLGDSRLQGDLASGNTGCTGAFVTTTSAGYMPIADCFVSRATTALYTGSDGLIKTAAIDTVRVDYAPVSHALNGFLVEPAATNLYINSVDLSTNAKWTRNGAPVFNFTTVAPDGSTAYSVSSANSFSGAFKSAPVSVSTTYTMSAFVKNISGDTTVRLGFSSGFIDVNSSTGVVTLTNAVVGTPSCKAYPNGWYRCQFATTTPGAGATANGFFYNRMAAAAENAFWGPQVELGTSATSYIQTTVGAVTRAADIYRLP